MEIKIIPVHVFTVEITKPIAFLSDNYRVQEASLSYDKKRFYIQRGSAGGITISVNNVNVLAQKIYYSVDGNIMCPDDYKNHIAHVRKDSVQSR